MSYCVFHSLHSDYFYYFKSVILIHIQIGNTSLLWNFDIFHSLRTENLCMRADYTKWFFAGSCFHFLTPCFAFIISLLWFIGFGWWPLKEHFGGITFWNCIPSASIALAQNLSYFKLSEFFQGLEKENRFQYCWPMPETYQPKSLTWVLMIKYLFS